MPLLWEQALLQPLEHAAVVLLPAELQQGAAFHYWQPPYLGTSNTGCVQVFMQHLGPATVHFISGVCSA